MEIPWGHKRGHQTSEGILISVRLSFEPSPGSPTVLPDVCQRCCPGPLSACWGVTALYFPQPSTPAFPPNARISTLHRRGPRRQSAPQEALSKLPASPCIPARAQEHPSPEQPAGSSPKQPACGFCVTDQSGSQPARASPLPLPRSGSPMFARSGRAPLRAAGVR